MTTIETGTIAFIVAGIMMETVVGVIDNESLADNRFLTDVGNGLVSDADVAPFTMW